jgi:hypothetical protein
MRIGSYDEPVYLLRITEDPLAFRELKIKYSEGRALLRSMVGKHYGLSNHGYPITGGIINAKDKREKVRDYVDAIYGLNQAIGVAIGVKNRLGLRDEIPKIAMPDMRPHLKPEIINIVKPSDNNKLTPDELLAMGSEMEISPQACKFRDRLGDKRRDLNQFYLTQSFLYPLAMMGIISDPLYATAILSSEGFGLKDNQNARKNKNDSWEVRLQTIRLLESMVESYWKEFEEHRRAGLLPVKREEGAVEVSLVTFLDLVDNVMDLEAIQNALTQRGCGVFDRDEDVKNKAEETVEKSFKAQCLITKYLNSQGYSIPRQAI